MKIRDALGQRTPGFTAIELLIVVVIVAVIAAVAIPWMLRALRGDEQEAVPAQQAAAPAVAPPARPSPPPAALPTTESAEVEIRLKTSHHLQGSAVFTRYQAALSGRFIFRNEDPQLDRIRLRFPFPLKTAEARGVSLRISRRDGEMSEPAGVAYERWGIDWSGDLPRGDRLAAEIAYTAEGRDEFVYPLPGAGRAGNVRIMMDIEGMTSESVPERSLQPTQVAPGRLTWALANLVTDRAIVVDLPGELSPIGRMILLSKLVGLAVLLFGAGFWYLSEGVKPGGMRKFTWIHFFLLALTYSLFFIVFAVLSLRFTAGPWLPMAVAAALSLPLLVLHIARLSGMRFALARGLPLAVFTLALVIIGAYGAGMRDLIYLAATVLILAYITITWRKWAEGRKAFRELHDQEQRRKSREETLDKPFAVLTDDRKRAESLLRRASDQSAAEHPSASAELSGATRLARSRVDAALERLTKLENERERLKAESDENRHKGACERLLEDADVAHLDIVAACDGLQRTVEASLDARKRAEAMALKERGEVHCIACGSPGAQTPHCAECGTARPFSLPCRGCGQEFQLPVHVLDRRKQGLPLYCMACGMKHKPVFPQAEPGASAN